VRDVTNAWIGAAFPARRDVPRTALEFIAQRLSILLNPTPRDPGLFGTDVRIDDLPDGPVIVVEAAVLPEEQARWEARILGTLAAIAGGYEDPALFPLHRRQFRNSTLTAESAPEVEGLRLAHDLLRTRELRDLARDIQGLQVGDIVREVAALGEPRILVFGPAMGGG
jgi:hypothetical protein